MELQIISDEFFIITKCGKKEIVRTPGKAVSDEHRIIAEKETALAGCRNDTDSVQARIEAALLAGDLTGKLRDELAAHLEVRDSLISDIGEAKDRIRAIWNLVDEHTADQIAQADKAKFAALIAPHDFTLENFQ